MPRNQWRYCVQDKFPAYITWDLYERIQKMLSDNYSEYTRNKTRGVPRKGKALLHGITYCGECGHKMRVQYKGGTQYLCNHLKQQSGATTCQRIGGDAIDDWVVSQFFAALSAAEINVAAEALRTTDTEHEQVVSARRQEVERLHYESVRAERQFMKSDPDNRLVTGELERRWEVSLRELGDAKQRLDQTEQNASSYMIPADVLEMLHDIGPQLPELWNSKLLKTSQQKSLLRSLVDKVVMHRLAADQIQVRIVWQGGATTTEIVRATVGKFASLSGAVEMEAAIEQMAREGRSDEEIATGLTLAGHCSPRGDKVLESTVRNVRLQKGILRRAHQSHPRRVDGFLTIPQLAKKLEISRWWISDRINNGTIKITKDAKTNCYLFPDTLEMLADMKSLVFEYQINLGCGKGHQDE